MNTDYNLKRIVDNLEIIQTYFKMDSFIFTQNEQNLLEMKLDEFKDFVQKAYKKVNVGKQM